MEVEAVISVGTSKTPPAADPPNITVFSTPHARLSEDSNSLVLPKNKSSRHSSSLSESGDLSVCSHAKREAVTCLSCMNQSSITSVVFMRTYRALHDKRDDVARSLNCKYYTFLRNSPSRPERPSLRPSFPRLCQLPQMEECLQKITRPW